MVPVRKTVEISDGVKVDLLFTPRIYVYQESYAPLPVPESRDESFLAVMERYADIMFFAALNAWEVDGHGTREEFPHKRGDFHGWMAADPKGFAEAVNFALCALTGKTLEQLAAENEKAAETAENGAKTGEGEKKKKRPSLISRITARLRPSS